MLNVFNKELPFVENSGLFVDAISTDNHQSTANRLSGGNEINQEILSSEKQ